MSKFKLRFMIIVLRYIWLQMDKGTPLSDDAYKLRGDLEEELEKEKT